MTQAIRGDPRLIGSDLEQAAVVIQQTAPELVISKRRLRQIEGISLVRNSRCRGGTRVWRTRRDPSFCAGCRSVDLRSGNSCTNVEMGSFCYS